MKRKPLCDCLCHELGGGGAHHHQRCTCNGGPVNEWTEVKAAPEPVIEAVPESPPSPPPPARNERLLERYTWKKVIAPKAWTPRCLGDELAGYYGGKTTRHGRFGEYTIILIHVPGEPAARTISGVRIIQLIDSSLVCIGHAIRVQYLGMREISDDRKMKEFNVYIAEGEPVAEQDLPKVRQ